MKRVCFEYLVRPALWWQLTCKLHVVSVYAILCYSFNVKYVVTVTSHTLWRHGAIRHPWWWRILPYTALIHVARLRVGDTWNFGDKQIRVLRRIIASQCVCRVQVIVTGVAGLCFYALEGVYGSTCLAVCLTIWAFQIENRRTDTNVMPF